MFFRTPFPSPSKKILDLALVNIHYPAALSFGLEFKYDAKAKILNLDMPKVRLPYAEKVK